MQVLAVRNAVKLIRIMAFDVVEPIAHYYVPARVRPGRPAALLALWPAGFVHRLLFASQLDARWLQWRGSGPTPRAVKAEALAHAQLQRRRRF